MLRAQGSAKVRLTKRGSHNVAINWVLLPSPGGLWGNIGEALGGLGLIWWCFGVALGVALGGFLVTLG